MANKNTSPLAMGRMQKGSAVNKKKKKDEEERKAVAKKRPQSSFASKPTQPRTQQSQPTPRARTSTQQRTVDPKEARRQESARNMRTAATRFSSEDRRTAAQAQKMNMPTAEQQRKARQATKAVGKAISNSVKESMTDESRARMQRQKSGIQTEEDKRYNEQRNQKRIEVAKNTGRAAKKGVEDTLTGYGKTLADIDEMAKSSDKWTEAKSMKLGIDKDDTAGRAKVEEERQKSIKEARRLRLALGEKQEKRQQEFDEATKNATGLEKAWYGAVESGTGMATDMAVGAVTGTGQVGALASMGIRSYGATRGQAEKEGATENEDRLYSLLQAGKEVGTEMMFQGAGLAKSAFSGGKVGLSLADRAANSFTRNMTGRAADATAAGIRLLGGTAEENAEEFAGWLADPVIKELTYGRNVRQREAKAALKEESDAIRANITSEEDARSAAAYLNSDRFIEEYTQQYKDAGLKDAQAREAAEQMREYLTASLSGDIDRMAELEDDIAQTVGGKFSDSVRAVFSGFDKGELMDTFASTSLLTLTTGLPAGISTAAKGSAIRDSLGSEGVRALSETAINFEDGVASLKAQAARDRIDEGKELTSTQVYDLAQAQAQQVEKDFKRSEAASGVAETRIKNENYVMPELSFGRDGSVAGDEIIAANYVKESNAATDIIEDLMEQEGAESLTDTEVQNGSRAIAGFKTGAFTVADANALNYTNTTVRTAFSEATGVDLNQYVVKDKQGNIDIPKTNAATKDALFAMAADNYVKTAEAETANWMDNAKGEVVTEVTSRMGAQGSVALQAALDDVDERDRSTYMMNANAADMMYQTARNMGTEWNTVKAEAARMFPKISEQKLEDMYNAGLKDRADASTAALGKQVKIGDAMDLSGEAEAPKGNVFIDTEYSPKGSVVRVFSEIATNLGVDIHLVDDLRTGTGTQANGQYINGAIYININSDFEKNVGYIFMHEVTHHLKKYAPEQYQALEDLVREKWFNANPEQMQNEIAKKIDLYKRNGQTLSEEEALEEIIADAAHEFINDSNFARQAAETDPSLAKAVLNSIRNALRAIRRILAFSNLDDETHMNTLFSQLGILDEAEKLWLDAYTQAVKNRAAVGIDEWQEEVNVASQVTNVSDNGTILTREDVRHSLSENFPEYNQDKVNLDIAVDAVGSLYDQQISWADYLEGDQDGETERQQSKPVTLGQLTWSDLDWSEETSGESEDGFSPSMRRNKDNNSGIRTVGRRIPIPEEIIQKGYIDLRGHKVSKPEDLVKLCQVLRNPMFETSRIFYLKGDTIVGHRAVSSHLPMQSAGTYGKGVQYWSEEGKYQKDVMARLGADGYYIMHNHPSGHVEASSADKTVTKNFRQYVPGLKGHIILDHNKFGWITPGGRASEKSIPDFDTDDPLHVPSVENDKLGMVWSGKPDDIAAIGRDIVQSKDGYSVVVYLTSHLEVNELQEINNKVILNDKNFANYIKNENTRAGSGRAIIYTTDLAVQKLSEKLVKTKHFEGVVYEKDPKTILFSAGKDISAWGKTIKQKSDYISGGAKAADNRTWYQEDGTRLSLSDTDYMAAVESGDMETAQRMVDEAAARSMPRTKLAGKWYHGTENEFTEFNFSQGGKNGHADGYGIYLTNDPEVASSYGSRMIEGYVNVERPASALTTATLTKSELHRLIKRTVDNEAETLQSEGYDSVDQAKFDTWISNYTDTYYAGNIDKAIDEVIDAITNINGNDYDIVLEIMTGMGIRDYEEASAFYDILTEETGIDGFETKWGDESEMADPNTPTIALAFRSNQIKDASPVTYDNDGNVIPLSERFNMDRGDIRFSISDESRVMYTPKGIEVVKNPTDSEYSSMREEILAEYPWLRGTGEPLLRHTYDESGNEYYWSAFDGMHRDVEPYINRQYNTRTSQQWKWYEKPDKDDYPTDYSAMMTRYSIAEDLDEPYMDAVNSGNMEEAQRLVDEAAKMAGYNTPRLYHGTHSFGFTTFDLGRGENIIFATSNPLTAETYSEETSRTRISDAPEIDVDKLSGEELLKEAAKRWNKYNSYRLMTPEEKESALKDARLDVKMYASIASDFIDENKDAFNDEKLAIANRAVDSLERLSTAWKDDEVDNAWNDFEDAIWDLKWADESIQLELSRAIQSGGSLLFAKNRISDFMYAGNIYKDNIFENTGYIFDNQLALELEADLHKGIYGLYGKGDNQLVIDANGSNWNQITPPDELNLYGPQRTRSIAEAAKAKGYDSVLFKNLKDNGGGTPYNGISDVYMFFNPSQVKSADTVTYADDGSIIPLSERFDPNNNDIRYSLPTQDADGNILSDGQMDYFKNSQARDEKGRLVPVYHGTFRGPRITVFEGLTDGIWFTSDRDIAEEYSMGYEMGIPGAMYGDVRNPYDSDDEYFAKKGIRIEQNSNGDWVAAINRNGREHYWGGAETKEELIDSLYESNENEELFDSQFTLRDVYPVYLNLENPKIIECNGSMHDDINGTGMTTRELAAEAMAEGYDGIIFRDVVDPFESIDVYVAFSSNQIKDINNENPTENPDIRYSIPSEDEVMNFAQTESNTTDDLWYTDPVLQEGVVRYSVSKEDFINGVISKWNPAWKTEGHVLKDASVEPAIRNVIMGAMRDSDTNVKYRQKVVKDTMLVARQAYDKMKSDNYTEAAELLYDHAHSIIENLEFFGNQDQSEFERYKNLRDYLRKTKFTVPEDKRSDIDYEAYRRRNFRKILLGSDGVAPDKEWQNLHEIWPEVFTEDIKGDIPSIMLQLENAVEVYQPYAEAYSSEQCEEFAGDIADSLYDIIYEGEAYKSLADKYDDKAKAMRERHREAMQKVKDNYKEKLNEKTLEAKRREYRKLDAQKAKLTDKYEQKLSDTKDMYERKLKTQQRKADFEIATLKQNREYNIKRLQAEKTRAVEEERRRSAYKVADNRREQRERTMHRQLYNRVLKEYKDLTHRLLNPTKEKAKNIPEQLRQPLAQMLHCFDLEKERSKKLEEMYMIPTRSQLNFRELKDALDKVTKEDPTAYEISDIHEYLKGKMTELADRVDGKTIDSLDIADLQTIKELLVGLNSAIKNGQQLEIDGENYQKQVQCDKLGEGAAEYQKLHGKAKTFSGPREWWDNIANMGELTPVYFFRQIKGLYDMYRQIRRGFDSYVRNEKMVIDKIADILAPYYKTNRKGQKVQGSEIEDWRHSESAETFDLIVGNQTITLTIAQKMSLYCLAKRDQAQKHMFAERGGVVASEITAGSKIHKAEELLKGKIVEQRRVVLTPADIQNIIATLTDEQKEIADNLQKLMTDDMAKLGNETSVKLTGIEMYKEKEYFPIKVQGDSRATNPDNIGIQEKIRNPGFSNPLQGQVSNPIIVDDIFTVVASHCNEMNQYAAYAVPITNFMKVYNGDTLDENGEAVKIKTVIRETYGDKAITYIENFINDINGNSFRRHGGLDDVLDKALGQAKKAAVFANLRVALQQPTAIIRAFAVMKVKYFKGVKPSAKETQEMFDHCPIAQWKSWGYYDTHFGRDIEDVMMGKNIPSKMDYIMSEAYGWFDNMTWGMIWQAVKNEVKESNPNVEYGSEEFWELCNERASFVFDSTQVVDSPFHRSDSMRSKNGLVKQMTSFQAEPTLSFNVLRQAFVDAFEESKKGNNTKAKQILGRMLAVWVGQAAFVALAQSMVDALRRKGHKDDDDDEDDAMRWYEVLMKYFTRNYVNNFKDDINPINNIYFIKDIVPGLLNAIKGEYVYGQQNLTFQWLDTLTNGIQMCKKKWEKGEAYSKTWYECLTELFGGLGYAAGLPVKTVMRGAGNAVYWLNKTLGVSVFADDGTVDGAVDRIIAGFRNEGPTSSSTTGESRWFDYENNPISIADGSIVDNALNKIGVNLTANERKAAANERLWDSRTKKAEEIGSKYADLSGEERDKKVWSAVTTYFKSETEDSKAFADMVTSGDYASINAMRRVYMAAGGEAEYFDERVLAESKKALKKTLKYGQTAKEIDAQANIQSYLTSHGMTDDEVSDIIYKSDVAKDMKVAFRLGDKDLMLESLEPLVNAGLTYNDLVRLWDNRNRMDLSKYKGRYKDKLKSTGKFIWPTEGVITSHFGYRNAPTAGASSNHPAIDIGAPQGTAVVAADGGTVIYAGRNSGYGNSVGIKHDNGMVTYYNHLYSWNVKVGDTVGQGQQIAQVGSTGISTGPHLDFKILDANGEPVDPEQYLQKRQ